MGNQEESCWFFDRRLIFPGVIENSLLCQFYWHVAISHKFFSFFPSGWKKTPRQKILLFFLQIARLSQKEAICFSSSFVGYLLLARSLFRKMIRPRSLARHKKANQQTLGMKKEDYLKSYVHGGFLSFSFSFLGTLCYYGSQARTCYMQAHAPASTATTSFFYSLSVFHSFLLLYSYFLSFFLFRFFRWAYKGQECPHAPTGKVSEQVQLLISRIRDSQHACLLSTLVFPLSGCYYKTPKTPNFKAPGARMHLECSYFILKCDKDHNKTLIYNIGIVWYQRLYAYPASLRFLCATELNGRRYTKVQESWVASACPLELLPFGVNKKKLLFAIRPHFLSFFLPFPLTTDFSLFFWCTTKDQKHTERCRGYVAATAAAAAATANSKSEQETMPE